LPLAHVDAEPSERTAEELAAGLNAYLALWHPGILARCESLPRWAGLYELGPQLSNAIVLVPEPSLALLDPQWPLSWAASGAHVLTGGRTRREFLERLEALLSVHLAEDSRARHFYALGLARLWYALLCLHLGREEALDHEKFRHETLQAATACSQDDLVHWLSAAYQTLAAARNHLYPVDVYTIVLVLLDGVPSNEVFETLLAGSTRLNLLLSGFTAEQLGKTAPGWCEQIRHLLRNGRLEVVGGEFVETRHTLLPMEALLWSLTRGREAYRQAFGQEPLIYGRRTFGLSTHLPAVLNKENFYYSLHLAFDGSEYPEQYAPKFRWEGAGTSSVEALGRVPGWTADPRDIVTYGRRLAQTIAADMVATTVWVHRCDDEPFWFELVREIARQTTAFGRWTTLTEYFQTTMPSDICLHPTEDSYRSNFLGWDHEAGRPNPVSRYAWKWTQHGRFQSLATIDLVCRALGQRPPWDLAELESALWMADENDLELERRITKSLQDRAELLARSLLQESPEETLAWLVVNPGPVPVHWCGPPDSDDELHRSNGWPQPIGSAAALVPAFGYAWAPAIQNSSVGPGEPGMHVAEADGVVALDNGLLVVEIDRQTGILKALARPTERIPRLAAQPIAVGLHPLPATAPTGEPTYLPDLVGRPPKTIVRAHEFQWCQPHPDEAVVRALVHLQLEPAPFEATPQLVAAFQLKYRLRKGWPVVQLTLRRQQLARELFDRSLSPWQQYVGLRVAWADPASAVVRGLPGLAAVTRQARIEAPVFLEIQDPPRITTVLSTGLPFWVRHHRRMADLILWTATEGAPEMTLGLGVDLDNPYRWSTQLKTDLIAIPVVGKRPRAGAAGWFFHLETPSVLCCGLQPLQEDGKRFLLRLLETTGRPVRARWRCWRRVEAAYSTDFHGEPLFRADVEDDTITIDLLPHELAQLEVTLA
jgi:hypothetical protein